MLKTENLTVKYDAQGADALHDVSITLGAGERAALIGANGAGKSTFLLSLVGVLSPSSGIAMIDGVTLHKETLKEVRQKAGMVFQNPDDQLFMPTVFDDIAFGPRNYGVTEAEIKRRASEITEKLGISHLTGRMTHKLSGGEKRLAALAGVLVMEPRLLLLDEPTSFLDPRAARRLRDSLLTLPHTMLIATHDLGFAQSVCTRAIALKDGAVFADAPIADVLSDAELLEECGL